ncbi:MAG TPA: hypothetical protein DEA45_01385 [Acholeplasmataceae bacterium]|nr:hypothetical protein [Acholeplasmataceae bacterium]
MGQPLQQQSNQSLNERFLEFFTAKAGVHAVTTIDGYVAQDYFTKDLLNQQAPTRENVYMTLNTSKVWSRKKKHVCQLNAITIDLDVYNVNMTIEHALYLLPYVLKDEGIHYPTAIQISGNGIYLHWKLEEQIVNNRVMVTLYEKITSALQEKLKILGADGQSIDILHLFRMPGTLNVKNKFGTTESYIVELNEHLIYELQDFTDELLPEIRQRKTKKKRMKTPAKGSVRHLFNQYTLALARARDLKRLAQMRNYDMDGYRHNLIFFYAVFLTQANQDNYQEQTHALNDLLSDPLHEIEVEAIFKTIEQKMKTDSEDPYDYSYLPKNETLIEKKFDITSEEQTKMETIVGESESRRRDRNRKKTSYEPIKQANKSKKEQRDELIHQLHQQGLNNTQIAKEMGVHRNTVANVLKAKKEPK